MQINEVGCNLEQRGIMKKITVLLLCILLLFTFVACVPNDNGGDNGGNTGGGGTDSGNGGNSNGNGELVTTDFSDEATAQNEDFYKKYSQEEKELYYTLWKENTQISVKVDIAPAELAKINEAYGDAVKSEIYRKCNLTITVNGTDYYFEEVGVRMRGNTSRRNFCDENGNVYDYVHFRFSLTETFDGEEYQEGAWGEDIANVWTDSSARKARKNRTFATMKKFYYKWNKNYDNTYVREIYANKMFRAYGILAPHITLAQVSLKQSGTFESLGVAMLYETVDKQFLKRNFSSDEAGGDLYKCTWASGPANLTSTDGRGVEVPGQKFTYSLKTNDDRTAADYGHHKHLIALIETLNNTKKTDEDFREKVESVIDMDYFCNFEAVNYLLGNPDCIRNNANNYYLYFLPQSGKAFIIPYDYDRCLGINVDWNPSGDGMTTIKPYAVKGANGDTNNPLYTKTILSGGTEYYRNLYKTKLQNVLDGEWFTYNHFKSVFQNYQATYAALVTPSEKIQQQCGEHIRMGALEFSERGTTDKSATDDNLTAQNYIELKRTCALKNI